VGRTKHQKVSEEGKDQQINLNKRGYQLEAGKKEFGKDR
jgi:hypothetical protein